MCVWSVCLRPCVCVCVIAPHAIILTRLAVFATPPSQDVNTILHDNFENCRLLTQDKKWQFHIFHIFTDILTAKKNEDPVKSCFAYTVNALTLVHFQYFMKSDQFEQVLSNSLYMLHQFGGSTNEGQEVAR